MLVPPLLYHLPPTLGKESQSLATPMSGEALELSWAVPCLSLLRKAKTLTL